MDAELDRRGEALLTRYVTLRRPRIHQAPLQVEANKRRCQRPCSPLRSLGVGNKLVSVLESRPASSPLVSPRAGPMVSALTSSPALCLTPVLERLRVPASPATPGCLHRARRPRPETSAGSPLEREAGRILSVNLENCLGEDSAFPPTPTRIANRGVSWSSSRTSPEASLPSTRCEPWLSHSGMEGVSRLMQPPSDEESGQKPLGEHLDCGSPGPAASWGPSPDRHPPTFQSSPPSPSAPRTPPLLSSRWKFSPFIQTVKSKLESFAGIFLSPVRSHLSWPGPGPPAAPVAAEPAGGVLEKPPAGEEGGRAAASPGRRGVNIQVKIAISGSPSPDGPSRPLSPSLPPPPHPPQNHLCRSHSCPDLPSQPAHRQPLPRPPPRSRRRRRHTLGGAEPARELGGGSSQRHRPPSFPRILLCLRKEVFPDHRLITPPRRESGLAPGSWEGSHRGHRGSSPSRLDCPLGGAAETQPQATLASGDLASLRNKPLEAAGSTPRKRRRQHLVRDYHEGVTPDKGEDVSGREKLGKVSRFRIRKTPVRSLTNLTPMGLPKPARLNKKEFSLEEIYTNKNYKAPNEKRTFATIFEEPVRRNGLLVLTSQRRLKRAMEFQDSSLPRKRRLRQRLCQAQRGAVWTRNLRSAMKEPQLELLLKQRLAELDRLFASDDG